MLTRGRSEEELRKRWCFWQLLQSLAVCKGVASTSVDQDFQQMGGSAEMQQMLVQLSVLVQLLAEELLED